jgi:hypothetical protein
LEQIQEQQTQGLEKINSPIDTATSFREENHQTLKKKLNMLLYTKALMNRKINKKKHNKLISLWASF